MTAAALTLTIAWAGVVAYAVFGGADFGAGIWHMFTGRSSRGSRQRAAIEHSLGPVWEANHVWLIFVAIVVWTAFSPVFAAVASTAYIPLTLVAIGLIARGAAFAFRKVTSGRWQRWLFGALFAVSSLATPFLFGAVAGGIASGQVPAGLAEGDVLGSWLNPTSVVTGTLAVAVCAYLAAVFLTADARRGGDRILAEVFRGRAIAAGLVTGVLAFGGIAVAYVDAPELFEALTGRGLVFVVASVLAGTGSLVLLARRRFLVARVTAALAVSSIIGGWAIAQYPVLIPGLGLRAAAAPAQTLVPMLGVVAAGGVVLLPSLVLLYWLFQRKGSAVGGQQPRGIDDRPQPAAS